MPWQTSVASGRENKKSFAVYIGLVRIDEESADTPEPHLKSPCALLTQVFIALGIILYRHGDVELLHRQRFLRTNNDMQTFHSRFLVLDFVENCFVSDVNALRC